MRQLSDWLTAYLDYTKDHESPESFHFWTGVSLLSATTRRRIYMDRGMTQGRGAYILYPNVYIVIVADSARVRKSVPITMGMDLIQEAVPDVYILQDRMTSEGLVKHLNRTTTTKSPAGQSINLNDSSTFIVADELATLLSYDRFAAARMSMLLTQGYNAQKHYSHLTAKDDRILLHNLYFTLLAATAPQNLKVIPEEATGGLIGRIIFITASKKRKRTAWPDRGSDDLRLNLINDLAQIATLEGEIKVPHDSKEVFTKWYESQPDLDTSDARLAAFHERSHDTALKLAMLLSLSRSDDMIVKPEHIISGINIVETLIPDLPKTLTWTSQTEFGQGKARFIDILRRCGGKLSRSEMLRAMGVSADELNSIESTVVQSGEVLVDKVKQKIVYVLL